MSMYWKWWYFYFSATFSFHHLRIEPLLLLLLLLLLFVYFFSISLNFFLSLVFFSFWFFFVAFCNCLFVRDTNKKERNSKNKCSCRAQLQCTQMCVKVATKLILCVVTRFKMLSVFGITGKWNVKREKKILSSCAVRWIHCRQCMCFTLCSGYSNLNSSLFFRRCRFLSHSFYRSPCTSFSRSIFLGRSRIISDVICAA